MQDRIKELAVEAGAMVECDTLTVNGKDAHDFIDALSQAVARECADIASDTIEQGGVLGHYSAQAIRARFGLGE